MPKRIDGKIIERIKTLKASGSTNQSISKELGVSLATVSRHKRVKRTTKEEFPLPKHGPVVALFGDVTQILEIVRGL